MGPLVPTGRIVGLDVARCVALIGMIATHTLVSIDEGGVTFVQQLAGGRSSALFAVLAGVSVSLMSGGTTPVRGTERMAVSKGLAVRAALVTLIGLLLGAFGTTILVILAYYGVLFLLGIPFLGLRARWLAALSAGWLVVVPVLSFPLRRYLPQPRSGSPTFEWLADPGLLLSELMFTGTYPALPWLAYLLAGMALGRTDLRRPRTAVVALVVGAVAAASSYAASALLLARPGVKETLAESPVSNTWGTLERTLQHGLLGVTPTDSWWWLAVRAPHSATPFDIAHTMGSALVAIGLALLLGTALPRVSTVVFGAGAMTLTLYSLHVVLRTPEFLPDDDPGTFAAHVLIVLVLGATYRLLRRSGPLERLVSSSARGASDGVRSRALASAGRPGGEPPG